MLSSPWATFECTRSAVPRTFGGKVNTNSRSSRSGERSFWYAVMRVTRRPPPGETTVRVSSPLRLAIRLRAPDRSMICSTSWAQSSAGAASISPASVRVTGIGTSRRRQAFTGSSLGLRATPTSR